MITAIALDDEPLPLEVLDNYARKTEIISLVKTFTVVSEARNYLKDHTVDLLFLDIQMPSLSGIDFYKSLQEQPLVIFTTAHSEFAVEGFNLSAVDYLLKPYSFERYSQAVTKAQDIIDFRKNRPVDHVQHIFVRAEYSLQKVVLNEVLYLEGLADYIKIHFANSKPLIVRMTMKEMAATLPSIFQRVHRSFIVPLNRIESVRNKTISLAGKEIPIGASYEEAFTESFKNFQ